MFARHSLVKQVLACARLLEPLAAVEVISCNHVLSCRFTSHKPYLGLFHLSQSQIHVLEADFYPDTPADTGRWCLWICALKYIHCVFQLQEQHLLPHRLKVSLLSSELFKPCPQSIHGIAMQNSSILNMDNIAPRDDSIMYKSSPPPLSLLATSCSHLT